MKKIDLELLEKDYEMWRLSQPLKFIIKNFQTYKTNFLDRIIS